MNEQLLRLIKPMADRLSRLAARRRYIRESSKIFEEPRPTPMGFKLAGNKAMQSGAFEPEETRIVEQLLGQVDTVVNIGANIGYYCCIALARDKYVVAFEPMQQNLRYLLRNIKANNWESRIEVYPLALSDRVGVIEIYGGGTGASLVKGWAGTPEHHVTLVPRTTLDNALGTRFAGKQCLMLVDIEGAERLMLAGASIFIAMDPKPVWLVEVSISEHQPDGIKINPHLSSTFEVFWDSGYEAWTADSTCRLIQPDEIRQVVSSGTDTLHTHNFLFIEKGHRHQFLSPHETLTNTTSK